MKTLAFNVTHRKISRNTLPQGDGQEGAQRRDDNGFGCFRAAITLFTTPRQERPPPLQVLQEQLLRLQEQLLLLQEQLLLQALVPLHPPSPRPQLLAWPASVHGHLWQLEVQLKLSTIRHFKGHKGQALWDGIAVKIQFLYKGKKEKTITITQSPTASSPSFAGSSFAGSTFIHVWLSRLLTTILKEKLSTISSFALKFAHCKM